MDIFAGDLCLQRGSDHSHHQLRSCSSLLQGEREQEMPSGKSLFAIPSLVRLTEWWWCPKSLTRFSSLQGRSIFLHYNSNDFWVILQTPYWISSSQGRLCRGGHGNSEWEGGPHWISFCPQMRWFGAWYNLYVRSVWVTRVRSTWLLWRRLHQWKILGKTLLCRKVSGGRRNHVVRTWNMVGQMHHHHQIT